MVYPDKYLAAVVHFQGLFLADYDLQSVYDEIVKKLAQTVVSGTVCVYEKCENDSENEQAFAILKSQVMNIDKPKFTDNHVLYKLNLESIVKGWLRPLRAGVIISGHLKDFDLEWQIILGNLGLTSFTFIPIALQNKLQAIIVIYHCGQEHVPTKPEINLFNVIANQLTAFIGRKNTENKLLSYKRIFEESNLSVFVLNANGYHIETNFSYRQLAGYDSDEELKNLTPEILFGDNFIKWFQELKIKGYYNGQIEIKELDIVLELSSYLVQGEEGQILSYINIANDITERIQKDKKINTLLVNYQKINEELVENEQQLSKSEQQLRMLAENSFEMIALSTPDGIITYMSSSSEKLTGYVKEELYGQYLISFFHPDDLDIIQIESQRQITEKNKNIIITHRFLTKSGEYIWLESFTKFLYDSEGNIVNLQTSSRDVNEKIIANKALKNSEEKFRTLFNKTYDAIFIYRIVNKTYSNFIEINEVACRLLGYSREELLGLSLDNLVLNSQDLPQNTNDENVYFHAILIRKNKTEVPVEIAITVIHADQDVVIQAVARDITEKKQIQESIKAKEIAEKLLKIKTEFMANMSHEIRTPMNGILGMTHFLLNTNLDDKQKHYTKTVQKSAENLLMILNDILDLSKLEASKMRIKPKIFNLRQTILQLKGLFESVALQQNINLIDEWEYQDSEWIVADESRLLQVLTNLVSNGIKFTTKGSVKIRISKPNRYNTIKLQNITPSEAKNNDVLNLSLTIEPQENNEKISIRLPTPRGENNSNNGSYNTSNWEIGQILQIEIIDEGTGIDIANQGLLFDKFYQIDTNSNTKEQGTGLGLSICKQLVELWGGEISVNSEIGVGSNFWFTMPLVFATQEEIEKITKTQLQTEKTSIYFENLTVLIAEDIFVNQEVAKTMTEQLGCLVDVVSNGKEAVDAASLKNYDLVLMDIQMPIMNGILATKEIKTRFEKLEKKAPLIICLSANGMEEDQKKYLSEGFIDYISKPIEPCILQTKLAKWFSEKLISKNTINKEQAITTNNSLNQSIKDEKIIIDTEQKTVFWGEVLNQNSINKILSLVKNNKSRFNILLNSFDEDMIELISNAKKSIKNNEIKQLIADIHTIKGVTGTIGTAALYEFSKVFYTKIQENKVIDMLESITILEKMYQQASNALKKISEDL